ncbi:MAG: alcohol dehydrogenase (cytochrome c), partial [Gammaproteobacteria bacterium]
MKRTSRPILKRKFYTAGASPYLHLPALLLAVFAVQAEIQAPGFTEEQAARGQSAYVTHCAACHGENLSDGRFAPALKGGHFIQNWGSKSLDKLFIKTVTSMPTAAPNSLGDETYAAILAYLLKRNGVSAGMKELPAEPQKLAKLLMPASDDYPSGGLSVGVSLPTAGSVSTNPLDSLRPVTDAMLEDVPPADWLTWRRGNHALGFSPLDQIKRQNVGRLKVAWSWSLPAGPSTTIPLVHDGVIFVHGFGDVVQAIDAVTGSLLWQYRRWIPAAVPTFNYRKRSIALYDKYLYMPASDGHIVALDARTGELAWQTRIVDIDKGERITGGPLLARGKVMIGSSGEMEGGNVIVALDALTGVEAWRFNTIPKPGEPGGDSWNGMAWEARSGGSVWTVGSYDPDSGLAFFGPAPTYDTGPLANPINRPGITNDALYTNTTIALEPDTGRLAWHYQHFPNDQWDQDWSYERHILEMKVGAQHKTVIATGGKLGIYDVLEAKNGRYIASVDLGVQNIVTGIDARTGAKQ